MYTAQKLKTRIKDIANESEVTLKTMLPQCGLNINSLNQMTDKKGISCFSLAKIADYLGASTDYLLDREALDHLRDDGEKNCVVLFFDILGTSNKLLSGMYDDLFENATTIYNNMMKVARKLFKQADFSFSVHTYSDNFILCAPYETDKEFIERTTGLAMLAQHIQFDALSLNLLLRGNMTSGLIRENKAFVLGKPVLNTYTRESNQGSAPRIIVPERIAERIIATGKNTLIKRDKCDGLFYINYIDLLVEINIDNAAPVLLSRTIESLDKYKECENIYKKYLWIFNKIKSICKEQGKEELVDKVSANSNIIIDESRMSHSIKVGDNNSIGSITNGTELQLTTQEKDLLKIYNSISGKRQTELMQFAYKLEDNTNG